ncbi:unnamed protein product, partial [Ectocarpus sp. 13 AM-2016]
GGHGGAADGRGDRRGRPAGHGVQPGGRGRRRRWRWQRSSPSSRLERNISQLFHDPGRASGDGHASYGNGRNGGGGANSSGDGGGSAYGGTGLDRRGDNAGLPTARRAADEGAARAGAGE